MRRWLYGLIAAVVCLAASEALANGVIIIPPIYPPMPPPIPPRPWPRPWPRPDRTAALDVKQARLAVEIETGNATTVVEEVFHNPHGRQVDGTFLFPLPDGAAVSRFTMFVDGRELTAEVLDRDQAARIYEDIVRRLADPALLEYSGRRLIRARIFPIAASADVRVTLRYSHPLVFDAGLYAYRYPLDTNKHSPQPLQSLVVSARLRSSQPIKTVFSPGHKVDVSRPDDFSAVVGLEARDVKPDKDFVFYYSVGEQALGASALSFREAGRDGCFMLLVAPRMSEADQKPMPKDVAFVFDTSGSMSDNDKIGQARRALAFCLKSLAPEDRFAVVDFSTTARSFRPDLTPAAAENVAAAVEYVQGLQARGGTNIQEALTTALKMGGRGERPYFVVFLTDGLPTMGEEDPKALSDMVRKLASDRVRLFTFGVGHDVNAVLLDRLAEDNRGDRAYVAPGEDMELKVSSFYTKISCPMLSDVKVSLAKANTYDEFPRQAPDLFRGSQISVVGRYRSPGPVAIQVSGKVNGQPREFTFEATLADSDRTHDFLPRLWAVRKVGWLLDEIRLRGEKAELKDEVVRLSKEHGILTPYTSYLVTEDSPRGPRAPRPLPEVVFREVRERRAAAAKGAAASTLEAQVGAGAVAASRDVQALRAGDAEAAETAWLGKERDAAVRQVGDRTFYFDGVRWVVSAYDGKQETKKVAYFSDEYFQLIRRHPALARAFALGDRVIAELDGVFYEVVE